MTNSTNPAAIIWAALNDYRETIIPKGVPEYDAEWGEIRNAMANLTGAELEPEPADEQEPTKSTYCATLAYSVRVYGYAQIEAESMEQAAEIIRKRALEGDEPGESIWGEVYDVDHSTAEAHSIVCLEDEAKGETIEDVRLYPVGMPYDILSEQDFTKALKGARA